MDARKGPVYQVNVIIRVIAPVAAACLLLVSFVPLWGRYVLLFAMLTLAMIDEIVCWTAVAEYMHIHRVQPFANMSFGRFGDIVGLFLGFACSAAVFGSSLDGDVSLNVLVSIVVIGFVFMQAFFFKDSYTPFVEHKEMDDDLAEDRASEGERPRYGSWIRRCHLFAERYGLTPRQTEVLLLLARGYSMGSIESELVVSSHTVKAHVYGIYQKADIHSRQELMERIGEFEDDGVRVSPLGKPME